MNAQHRLRVGAKAWICGLLAAAAFLYSPIILKSANYDWMVVVTWVIVVLVLSRMASDSARKYRLRSKRREERQLLKVDAGKSSGVEEYVLFARPFAQEGKLLVPTTTLHTLLPHQYTEGGSQPLEEWLTRAFGDVRVLGGTTDLVGPLRKVTETDWQGEFCRLAENAAAIFVLPLDGAGTNWELGWLKSAGLLTRTVIIMPRMDASNADLAVRWAASQQELCKFGIGLPAYSTEGAYLCFSEAGEILRYPLKSYSKYAIQDLVIRLELRAQGYSARPKAVTKLAFPLVTATLIGAEAYLLESFPAWLLWAIIGLFAVPILVFKIADWIFYKAFHSVQGLLVGFVWLVSMLVLVASFGDWSAAFLGRIGYMRGLSAPVMFLNEIHLICQSVVASLVVSVTLLGQTHRTVITFRGRDVLSVALIWTAASLAASLMLWVTMPQFEGSLAVALAVSAFIGSIVWADGLKD